MEYEWRRVFALWPRRVEGRWIWLRWYEERRLYYEPEIVQRRLVR